MKETTWHGKHKIGDNQTPILWISNFWDPLKAGLNTVYGMWLDIYPHRLAGQPGVGASYPNFQKQHDSSHSTSMAVIAVELDMTGNLTSTTKEKEEITKKIHFLLLPPLLQLWRTEDMKLHVAPLIRARRWYTFSCKRECKFRTLYWHQVRNRPLKTCIIRLQEPKWRIELLDSYYFLTPLSQSQFHVQCT